MARARQGSKGLGSGCVWRSRSMARLAVGNQKPEQAGKQGAWEEVRGREAYSCQHYFFNASSQEPNSCLSATLHSLPLHPVPLLKQHPLPPLHPPHTPHLLTPAAPHPIHRHPIPAAPSVTTLLGTGAGCTSRMAGSCMNRCSRSCSSCWGQRQT